MPLSVADAQGTAMEPVARKGLAVGALALGDFVFVVREDEVRAAAVDVKGFSQVVAAHRRALDVPARTPCAPGGVPLGFAGLGVLPENEIKRITLTRVHVNARARLQFVQGAARELSVARELAHSKVHVTVGRRVREAVLFKPRDDVKHLRNEFRRMRLERGVKAPQGAHVFLHRLGEGLRELGRCDLALGGAPDDLVVHVGHVAHKGHLVARSLEPATDDVKRHEGAAVADMAVVIDRDAADVHPDMTGLHRFKRNHLVVQSGVKGQCHSNL